MDAMRAALVRHELAELDSKRAKLAAMADTVRDARGGLEHAQNTVDAIEDDSGADTPGCFHLGYIPGVWLGIEALLPAGMAVMPPDVVAVGMASMGGRVTSLQQTQSILGHPSVDQRPDGTILFCYPDHSSKCTGAR